MNNKLLKLFGLFLIVVGIGYLGDQMGFWYFTIFFRGWWAVLIALLGFSSILSEGINVFNGATSLLGIYFFLEANNIINLNLSIMMIFPVLCIIAGIKLLFSKNNNISNVQYSYDSHMNDNTNTESNMNASNSFVADTYENSNFTDTSNTKEKTTTSNDENNSNNTSFSFESNANYTDHTAKKLYVNSSFSTKQFKEDGKVEKCQVENIFGNVFLDLSFADLSLLDIISINSFFGNVEIHVPSNVNLKLYKNTMFSGSYIDASYCENGHDVFVRGTSIFGTIRIIKKPV